MSSTPTQETKGTNALASLIAKYWHVVAALVTFGAGLYVHSQIQSKEIAFVEIRVTHLEERQEQFAKDRTEDTKALNSALLDIRLQLKEMTTLFKMVNHIDDSKAPGVH